VVFVAGDRQDGDFPGPPNPNGCYAYSANVFRGNVSLLPSLSAYPGSAVRALAMSPENYQNLVVVDNQSRVWSSADEGVTWSNITANLSSLSSEVRAVVVLVTKRNQTKTLVAGQGGVFRHAGARWVRLRPGLPDALFWDLHFNGIDDVLVASSIGRGAWTLTALPPVWAVFGL